MINRGASGRDAPGILCLWIIWAIAWEGEVVAMALLQAQRCFFREGTALLAGKVAPGRWAELMGLQLPFPEIKDLSSSPLCLSVVGVQRSRAAPRSCSGKGLVILPSNLACVSSLHLISGAGGQRKSCVSRLW